MTTMNAERAPKTPMYGDWLALGLALKVQRAWQLVARHIERVPEAVFTAIVATRAAGDVPSRAGMIGAVKRRVAALELSAAGARRPADMDVWPADVHAMHCAAVGHGPVVTSGSAEWQAGAKPLKRRNTTMPVALAVVAAVAVWRRWQVIDRQAAAAPSHMDDLRKRKGLA